MEEKILEDEEVYSILQDEYSWYVNHRNTFNSISKSICSTNRQITKEDIKNDFYIAYIKKSDGDNSKKFRYKNGVTQSLVNYVINLAKKNKTRDYKDLDNFIYQKYYSEKFDKFKLSGYDKKYISFVLAREKTKISATNFGLYNIVSIKDKGSKFGGKSVITDRTKLVKLNYFYILLFYSYVINSLTDSDLLFIQFIRDTIASLNLSNYQGCVDVFGSEKYSHTIKEVKCVKLSNELLLKILKIIVEEEL